jgi:hypothetical protein
MITNSFAKIGRLVADSLSKASCGWGCVSAIVSNGQTIWIADAHRDDGKRFIVRSDERPTALLNCNRRFARAMDMTALRYPSSRVNSHQRISAAGAGTRAVR